MKTCGQTALEGIDKHLSGGAAVAHGLGNDRSDGYQLPAFPAMAVKGLSIGMCLERYFSLSGIDVGVVDIQCLVLPSLLIDRARYVQCVGFDGFGDMYMSSLAAEWQ